MRREPSDAAIPAEKLAYWYFRLNGCLMLENFVCTLKLLNLQYNWPAGRSSGTG